MAKPLIGYVTDDQLTLYRQKGQGWEEVLCVSPSQAPDLLAAQLTRAQPLHLLTDVIEMEFRQEGVTYLRGKTRKDLLARKLAQTFRVSPYRHAFSLGRDPNQKQQEVLLLTAITNPDLIDPWLTPLHVKHVPISGIASVPLLQGRLLQALKLEKPHCLLVSVQANRSIRVSYFLNQELRFSRLTSPVADVDSIPLKAFEEAARTHQYLLSLRMVDRNYPLDVACLVRDGEVERWHVAQPSAGLLHFHHFELGKVASDLGLKCAAPLESANSIYIGLLAKAKFPNHFAPHRARRDYYLLWLRQALIAASILIGSAGLAVAANWAYDSQQLDEATEHANRRIGELGQHREEVKASFPRTDVPVDDVRSVLQLYKKTIKENLPSRQMLTQISRGFDAIPQIELMELSWTSTAAPEQFKLHGAAIEESGEVGKEKQWVALLDCEVVDGTTYDRANLLADKLAATISGNEVEARILKYPLDVLSSSELREDIGVKVPQRLPFQLRVVWKR